MNPVPLFLIIVSLPLLLGGCGEKPVGEVKPELEGVNFEQLEVREGISYFKDTPYTGKSYQLWYNSNGQKKRELNYKDGKRDGLQVWWHENGQKWMESNHKDGKQEGLDVMWFENGQKKRELNYKDGKVDGLAVMWHKNGQKRQEGNWKDGAVISEKYWNSKGESVNSFEETGLK